MGKIALYAKKINELMTEDKNIISVNVYNGKVKIHYMFEEFINRFGLLDYKIEYIRGTTHLSIELDEITTATACHLPDVMNLTK